MCKNERLFCVFAETCDKSRCKREIIVITVDSVQCVAQCVENAGSITIFSGNDGFLQDVHYWIRQGVGRYAAATPTDQALLWTLCVVSF